MEVATHLNHMTNTLPTPYEQLKDKWLDKHKEVRARFLDKHAPVYVSLKQKAQKSSPKKLAAGVAGSVLLLLSPAHAMLPSPKDQTIKAKALEEETPQELLIDKLRGFIPEEMRNLNPEEEWNVAEILSEHFGFSVAGELKGKRLNRTYGLIGGEQHLYRYPGDSLADHAIEPADNEMFLPSGIAPALGAWGYFSPSEAEFDTRDLMRERYYLAVQTFMIPDYHERFAEYRDFFQFRKMLVVNTQTGNAVVAVIGDAGPAPWTGKHLGGSPEVMHYLNLAEGPRKGPVLYFLIDDPEDKIPLGPIS